MARNYILGSGVVGLLAKMILGNDWIVLPFNRSRFFSFNPALDDNFIIRDDAIDHFVTSELGGTLRHMYKIKYSIKGQLTDPDPFVVNDWLYKIFGADQPTVASPLYNNSRGVFGVYDIKINALYSTLLQKFMPSLQAEAQKGIITKIEPGQIHRGNEQLGYDKIVSTIPLPVLLGLMGKQHNLKSRPIYYHHIQTTELDFEGANQSLVVDSNIEFFKVTNVNKDRYLFYSLNDHPIPSKVFGQYMHKYVLIDGTKIDDALILGLQPNLSGLEQLGITCLGSYAEWDWARDVGSCIKKALIIAKS